MWRELSLAEWLVRAAEGSEVVRASVGERAEDRAWW